MTIAAFLMSAVLAPSPAPVESCSTLDDCLILSNQHFDDGESAEGIRSLIRVSDLAWKNGASIEAKAVLDRCAHHDAGQEEEKDFLSECAAFIDKYESALSGPGDEEVVNLLATAQKRLPTTEDKCETVKAAEANACALVPLSQPEDTATPTDLGEAPHTDSRTQRRSAWLFAAGSVAAASSVPFLVSGALLLRNAENRRSEQLQSEHFASLTPDQRTSAASEQGVFVARERLKGGILLASGAVLAVTSASLLTSAILDRSHRAGLSRSAAPRSRTGVTASPRRGGALLSVARRF